MHIPPLCKPLLSTSAHICTSYFKGQGRGCRGKMFEHAVAVDPTFWNLLRSPMPYNSMTATQQGWFSPNSSIVRFNSSLKNSCSGWPSTPCCVATNPTSQNGTFSTSRDICECIGGYWSVNYNPDVPLSFDSVPVAIVSLFQLSTFCSTIDAMWATVDQVLSTIHTVSTAVTHS